MRPANAASTNIFSHALHQPQNVRDQPSRRLGSFVPVAVDDPLPEGVFSMSSLSSLVTPTRSSETLRV